MAMKSDGFELFGSRGEDLVRDWLKKNGWCIVPTSLIENGGAPMLEGHLQKYVLPDNLATIEGSPKWIEVKTKDHMTMNKKRNRWETGCELRNWNDYLAVQQSTGIRGAIAFVHVREKRLLLGDLDVIGVDAATWKGPIKPGHAFTEPMIFFDVQRFSWFYLEESLLFHRISEARVEPKIVRPWETKGPPECKQEEFNFGTDDFGEGPYRMC